MKNYYPFTTVAIVVCLCATLLLSFAAIDGDINIRIPGYMASYVDPVPSDPNVTAINVYEQAVRNTVMVHMYNSEGRKLGHGSGVIISADGIVATARHCIQGYDMWVVEFPDGDMVTVTDSIFDLDDDCGLLYTKKECKTFAEIHAVPDIRIGDEIFIVGAPYDHAFMEMVTIGTFAKHAQLLWDGDYFLAHCSSYPGNSGGGVFNAQGQVIGLIVAGPTEHADISMCTPIDEIVDLLRQRAEGIR